MTTLRIDYLYTGRELQKDVLMEFSSYKDSNTSNGTPKQTKADDSGQILRLEPWTPHSPQNYDKHLKNRLVIPGILNCHSHAFQRAIRGRTQYLGSPNGDEDNFWSWRTQMYQAANSLSPDEIYDVSKLAFTEMRRAGYTTVGEFHYLHNRRDGTPYDNPNELAHRVIHAAKDAGIRITLIMTAYKLAAPGVEAHEGQRRFIYDTWESFETRVQNLYNYYKNDPMVTIAVAAHSIRALSPDAISRCHTLAEKLDIPFHIHVCEQQKELEQSRDAYGMEPIAWLDHLGALTSRTSLIHATHLAPGDIQRIKAANATVVACPTTERDLGDGFLPMTELFSSGIPVTIGTDSQTRIDPFEELRCIEYHERLLRQRRNIVAETLTQRASGPALLEYSQSAGRHSLMSNSGFLEESAPADFAVINLEHHSLLGLADSRWAPKTTSTEDLCNHLLSGLIFSGAGEGVVEDVYVAGSPSP